MLTRSHGATLSSGGNVGFVCRSRRCFLTFCQEVSLKLSRLLDDILAFYYKGGLGRTRTSDMQPRRATPLPCDHQSTMLKADKRGISTPLISAVSPAAAPFQTSCALLISPFFLNWQASGLEPVPHVCTCHRIQHRGSTCQPVSSQKDDASDGFEPFHCP